MNNKEFVSELSKKTGYSIADTQNMLNTVINTMSDCLQEGIAVAIPGFGSFEVKKKMERIIVNPATMQRMLVPPKLVLTFRPTVNWKDRVKRVDVD